jgi:hypothetical protein
MRASCWVHLPIHTCSHDWLFAWRGRCEFRPHLIGLMDQQEGWIIWRAQARSRNEPKRQSTAKQGPWEPSLGAWFNISQQTTKACEDGSRRLLLASLFGQFESVGFSQPVPWQRRPTESRASGVAEFRLSGLLVTPWPSFVSHVCEAMSWDARISPLPSLSIYAPKCQRFSFHSRSAPWMAPWSFSSMSGSTTLPCVTRPWP